VTTDSSDSVSKRKRWRHDVGADKPWNIIFLHDPRNRGNTAQKPAIPSEPCAGEDIIEWRDEKVVPFFDDE
jgi:hypothetical protein